MLSSEYCSSSSCLHTSCQTMTQPQGKMFHHIQWLYPSSSPTPWPPPCSSVLATPSPAVPASQRQSLPESSTLDDLPPAALPIIGSPFSVIFLPAEPTSPTAPPAMVDPLVADPSTPNPKSEFSGNNFNTTCSSHSILRHSHFLGCLEPTTLEREVEFCSDTTCHNKTRTVSINFKELLAYKSRARQPIRGRPTRVQNIWKCSPESLPDCT